MSLLQIIVLAIVQGAAELLPAYARTLVVDHSVPLPAAQQLLGHASVQTTAEYAKTDLRQLREFVDAALDDGSP